MHVTLGPVAVRPLLEELATRGASGRRVRGLVLASEVGPEGSPCTPTARG
jgi:hypothetical protein